MFFSVFPVLKNKKDESSFWTGFGFVPYENENYVKIISNTRPSFLIIISLFYFNYFVSLV